MTQVACVTDQNAPAAATAHARHAAHDYCSRVNIGGKLLAMLALLLQFAAASAADSAGRPPDRCLLQLPAQLLHTSWESKCACRTTGTLTSGRMEVSFFSGLIAEGCQTWQAVHGRCPVHCVSRRRRLSHASAREQVCSQAPPSSNDCMSVKFNTCCPSSKALFPCMISGRSETEVEYSVGFDADGVISALDCKAWCLAGAFMDLAWNDLYGVMTGLDMV